MSLVPHHLYEPGELVSKLYSYTYASVDGVVSSPETWVSPHFSDEMGTDLAKRLQSCAAMVLGRRTYDEFAQFWPHQGSDVPFADLNNKVRKFVVSDTLADAEWQNSSVVSARDLESLKSKGDLHVTGSGVLMKSLLESRLLDEIILMVCPVALGQGQRLLDGLHATGLELVSAESFPLGVMCLTYRPTT
jgi:dihydrofolate reductase